MTLFTMLLKWQFKLCSWTIYVFNTLPKEANAFGTVLEARHEIISELTSHCHDSEHLFISSRNDHKGISVAMHRAKTKRL